MMTPLVQVSGDTEQCQGVLVCTWSVPDPASVELLLIYTGAKEPGERTTGLCPNGPLHKVNHKKSVHSASNLLNKLLHFAVIR